MSSRLYFELASFGAIADIAVTRMDGETGDTLISFPGCPVGGVLSDGRVDMPFPRSQEIRDNLINWLECWGIPFCVIP
ncbi:hypothetical protein [Burkholderia gladioli]|uniref:hypothetical protein n=1 Tax=Burkholderia gladioli TaxID=28095 RepID=UPI0016422ECB|nr:hypothetical protein [Burkholderia gladioli]